MCCLRVWFRGRAVLLPFRPRGWRYPLLLSVAILCGSSLVAVPCRPSLVAVVPLSFFPTLRTSLAGSSLVSRVGVVAVSFVVVVGGARVVPASVAASGAG